jgi:S-adenosyl methyltransferase
MLGCLKLLARREASKDAGLAGFLDAVVVVAGSPDGARAGAVPSVRVDLPGDLGQDIWQDVSPALRGKAAVPVAVIVSRLLGPLSPGSYLVIADGANVTPAGNEAQRRYNEGAPLSYHLRSPEQISRFFEGLELAEPGVVSCSRWRPDPGSLPGQTEVEVYCGVARKPGQPVA